MLINLNSKFSPFVIPLIIILSWLACNEMNWVDKRLLPSIVEVAISISNLFFDNNFHNDFLATLYRWLTGFFFGCVIGVSLGLMVGISTIARKYLSFFVDFVRSIPVTAIYPLFLLLFGIGDKSKIAMVFVASVFIILINTSHGVLSKDSCRVDMAKSFHISKFRILLSIVIPDALPEIIIGMRLALSLSLIVAVVSEMFIGGNYGIGFRISDLYSQNRVDELYALIIITGILGYVTNFIVYKTSNLLVFWSGK